MYQLLSLLFGALVATHGTGINSSGQNHNGNQDLEILLLAGGPHPALRLLSKPSPASDAFNTQGTSPPGEATTSNHWPAVTPWATWMSVAHSRCSGTHFTKGHFQPGVQTCGFSAHDPGATTIFTTTRPEPGRVSSCT